MKKLVVVIGIIFIAFATAVMAQTGSTGKQKGKPTSDPRRPNSQVITGTGGDIITESVSLKATSGESAAKQSQGGNVPGAKRTETVEGSEKITKTKGRKPKSTSSTNSRTTVNQTTKTKPVIDPAAGDPGPMEQVPFVRGQSNGGQQDQSQRTKPATTIGSPITTTPVPGSEPNGYKYELKNVQVTKTKGRKTQTPKSNTSSRTAAPNDETHTVGHDKTGTKNSGTGVNAKQSKGQPAGVKKPKP